MPKNKVLTLYQKAKICEMSLKPGFNKDQCEKEFGIQRSCLNKILQSKQKFLDFADSEKGQSKLKFFSKGKHHDLEVQLSDWIRF